MITAAIVVAAGAAVVVDAAMITAAIVVAAGAAVVVDAAES